MGLRQRDTNVVVAADGKKKAVLAAPAVFGGVKKAEQLLPAQAAPLGAGALHKAPALDVYTAADECPSMDTAADDGLALGLGRFAAAALPAGVTDIDLDDMDNPQLVAEYVTEIYAYMHHMEVKQAPAANYMETVQKDLRVDMRAILIDWLVEVHQRFKLIQETFFLTVHILDRYLSVQPVTRSRLQLIGVCAMLIAAKYEEMYPPEVQDFIWVSRNAYTRADIITTEGLILRALDFDLGTPLPLHFLRRDSRAAAASPDAHNVAKYMMEVGAASYALLAFAPSQLAAASLYCAQQALAPGAPAWSATAAHYSGYSEAALQPCVAALRGALAGADKALPAVQKKFADAKMLAASTRPEVVAYIAEAAGAMAF